MNVRDDTLERAVWLTQQIQKRADLEARKRIENLDCGPSDYQGRLESLGIHADAWSYVHGEGINPKLVFAHPKILLQYPQASLYYRGIATLPYKRVTKTTSTSVKQWEEEGYTGRPSLKARERVTVLYNATISTIILGSDGWTQENGYRNILTTLGITNDGAWRNTLGKEGERRVQNSITRWLKSENLIPFREVKENQEYLLGKDPTVVRMRFSSEPDVSFERNSDGRWVVVSTIEIKSGTDPAGALERLGSIRKSFEETPAQSRNFIVLGVTTPTMRERLNDMNIAKSFDMWDILDGKGQREFINEVFHYTLRLIAHPW